MPGSYTTSELCPLSCGTCETPAPMLAPTPAPTPAPTLAPPCKDKKSPEEIPYSCSWLVQHWAGGQGCTGSHKDVKHYVGTVAMPDSYTTSELCPRSCGTCETPARPPCEDKKSPEEIAYSCSWLVQHWAGGQGCAGSYKDVKHYVGTAAMPGSYTTSELCPLSCGTCEAPARP